MQPQPPAGMAPGPVFPGQQPPIQAPLFPGGSMAPPQQPPAQPLFPGGVAPVVSANPTVAATTAAPVPELPTKVAEPTPELDAILVHPQAIEVSLVCVKTRLARHSNTKLLFLQEEARLNSGKYKVRQVYA